MKKNAGLRAILTRFALGLASIIVIVYALPRESGPSLIYDVDHPWMNPSLIATFDFPILKDTAQMRHERDSINLAHKPYYNLLEDMAQKQMENFFEVRDSDRHLPPALAQHLLSSFEKVYEKGILSTSEYNKLASDSTNELRIVNGKSVEVRRIGEVYSPLMAYEHLYDDPVIAKHRPIVQDLELNEFLRPNLSYDEERNKNELNEMQASVTIASGMVLSGQKIIDRGEIVDNRTYQVIASYEQEMKKRSSSVSSIPSTIAGQFIFVTILIVMMALYLQLFRKDYLRQTRSLTMLYSLIVIFPVLVSLMMRNTIYSVYLLPFTMLPMFVRVFMDSRTAFMAHVVMIFICAAAVKYQYEFIIIQIVAGVTAILSMRHLTQRSDLFRAAVYVTLASCLIYFSIQLMQDKTVSELDSSFYKYFVINGVLLLFAYPLMLVLEKVFNFTSEVTLIELSNTSKPLLRQLSEVAPGTFQHSIMVSNLAVEIAEKIGAQAQLVRTGALYHDIGKMTAPHFFTENQQGNNPLDTMDRKKAAKIVISHVEDGLRMAEKEDLPQDICDFIRTHHGNGMAKFFYITYCNEHPGEEVSREDFTYPGQNPTTKEQAILMMTDAVEAASRSLKEYSEESITALVNRIIDAQQQDGFFANCPINFSDIHYAKRVLIKRLMSIYHTRIAYPSLSTEKS